MLQVLPPTLNLLDSFANADAALAFLIDQNEFTRGPTWVIGHIVTAKRSPLPIAVHHMVVNHYPSCRLALCARAGVCLSAIGVLHNTAAQVLSEQWKGQRD